MEAKGGHGEAKGRPMEPKKVPKGCQGEAKRGQGEAKRRPREAKGSHRRPRPKNPKKNPKFWHPFGTPKPTNFEPKPIKNGFQNNAKYKYVFEVLSIPKILPKPFPKPP